MSTSGKGSAVPRPASLSLELLETFIALLHHQGDAAKTTQELGINQPSMSKRLKYFQHTSKVLPHPWLVLKGKTWELTEEGTKVRPAVEDLVRRYRQLLHFAARPPEPQVTFACGQHAVTGFVFEAFHRFRRERPDARLRVSTLRGEARIVGVANGVLDLATVTHADAEITALANRTLHAELLRQDRLALVCADGALWAERFARLLKTKASPQSIAEFPLILPAPDAGVRKQLDEVFIKEGLSPSLQIVLEIGGWNAILSYVREGVGVGIVSEAALGETEGLLVRYLDPNYFPPTATKLICRLVDGKGNELDLSEDGLALAEALRQAARKRGG